MFHRQHLRPRAQTTFTAVLPEALAPGESLNMIVMDEVTGLALNATTYPMQAKDNLTYTATLPLPLNAVVKYRYIRQTSVPINEDIALNSPIRYRLYYVAGQGEVPRCDRGLERQKLHAPARRDSRTRPQH